MSEAQEQPVKVGALLKSIVANNKLLRKLEIESDIAHMIDILNRDEFGLYDYHMDMLINAIDSLKNKVKRGQSQPIISEYHINMICVNQDRPAILLDIEKKVKQYVQIAKESLSKKVAKIRDERQRKATKQKLIP